MMDGRWRGGVQREGREREILVVSVGAVKTKTGRGRVGEG